MENKIFKLKSEISQFNEDYVLATTVQKRKLSRLIKATTKEIKQIQYAHSNKASNVPFSKQLLKAGAVYNEERTKGYTINKKETIRDRKNMRRVKR